MTPGEDFERLTASLRRELIALADPAPRIVAYELTPQRASLEEAFMEMTAGSLEYGQHGPPTLPAHPSHREYGRSTS